MIKTLSDQNQGESCRPVLGPCAGPTMLTLCNVPDFNGGIYILNMVHRSQAERRQYAPAIIRKQVNQGFGFIMIR